MFLLWGASVEGVSSVPLAEAGIEGTHKAVQTRIKVTFVPDIWNNEALTKKVKDRNDSKEARRGLQEARKSSKH